MMIKVSAITQGRVRMKRVLLVLAVLAFALPAVADPIVYFNGKPSSYGVEVSVNGSGSRNYTGGQYLLTRGAHESLLGVDFPGTDGVGSHWSGGIQYASSGFSGDVTHVLSNPQTEMLTGRYT